jgi:hypothetical protein
MALKWNNFRLDSSTDHPPFHLLLEGKMYREIERQNPVRVVSLREWKE